MTSDLAGAVAAYTSSVDALLAADVETPSHRELLALFAAVHAVSARVPLAGYAMLARLDREANPVDLGATTLRKAIALQTRMSAGEIGRQLKRARTLISRRTLQGEKLAPAWEYTADALSRGSISEEHVVVIAKFLTALPDSVCVDPTIRPLAERTLAEVATTLDPRGLTVAAMHLLALLHPDGEVPADEAARKVGLTLGPQQPDGTSYLRGWVSAKLRSMIEPLQAKFAERDRHRDTGPDGAPPEQPTLFDDYDTEDEADGEGDGAADVDAEFDESASDVDVEATAEERTLADADAGAELELETESDDAAAEPNPFDPSPDSTPLPSVNPLLNDQWRTKAQFTHDAFEVALDLLLRSGTLGRLNGLPTTVVVTTTLQELQRGAGYAVTGGGSRLPMRDLIAMAAQAYHYLAVFDEHTGMTLHLGRAQRCASGAQKLALFARERGCTCPGCTVDWYRTQAHHAVLDWKRDGQTDIDDLTLACGASNQMVEDTGWITRRRPDGRFEWVDPVTGRAHLNDLHHPERLLKPKEEDPP